MRSFRLLYAGLLFIVEDLIFSSRSELGSTLSEFVACVQASFLNY